VVRDLASKFGKQVELKLVGEHTELDKGLIEKLSDPLTHLVRNSLDHGIETPEIRQAAGKSAKGTLILQASQQGGSIVVQVIDDGAGLNRARILAKAQERGLPISADAPDHEVWKKKGRAIAAHFRKIDESEAVLIVNYEKKGIPDYIGANTFLEIGYAYGRGKKIFILNNLPTTSSYKEEILGMQPIVLHGKITALTT
jgi:hypothetical protein